MNIIELYQKLIIHYEITTQLVKDTDFESIKDLSRFLSKQACPYGICWCADTVFKVEIYSGEIGYWIDRPQDIINTYPDQEEVPPKKLIDTIVYLLNFRIQKMQKYVTDHCKDDHPEI